MSDMDVVRFVLEMARDNIAELVDDLRRSYEPEKGWPPHIEKSAEVLAEIDDLLAAPPTEQAHCGCERLCGDDGDVDGPGVCRGLPRPSEQSSPGQAG